MVGESNSARGECNSGSVCNNNPDHLDDLMDHCNNNPDHCDSLMDHCNNNLDHWDGLMDHCNNKADQLSKKVRE